MDGPRKVGKVVATDDGFKVNVHNYATFFKSKSSIEKNINLKFENYKKINVNLFNLHQFGIQKSFNIVYDIKRKIYIFTKHKKSKCYYAAGWYHIKMNNIWQKIHCPKYIFIQRYDYKGPFLSKEEIIE